MATSQFGIFQTSHLLIFRHSSVGPFKDLVVGHVAQGLQDVLSEVLPNDSQDQFSLSIYEIDSSDVGQMNSLFCCDVHCIVGILDLHDSLFGFQGDFFPVDDDMVRRVGFGFTDSLLEFYKFDSISEIFNEVVNIAILDV